MNISNGIYKEVAINWQKITLPLKEGTPVSAAGLVANSSAAVGLVPRTIDKFPLFEKIYVLVGGAVSLDEVNAKSGLTLSDDAKKAMSGIAFYGDDGTPGPDPVYVLPTATASVLGGVKIGDGISINSGKISVATASADAIGGVKIGAGLSINSAKVSVAAATASAIGGVKQAANVAVAAGDAPTKAEFDALISALITAGIMAAPASEG